MHTTANYMKTMQKKSLFYQEVLTLSGRALFDLLLVHYERISTPFEINAPFKINFLIVYLYWLKMVLGHI